MTKTIHEIKEELKLINDPDDPFLIHLKTDERKGVQTALKQWYKKHEAEQMLYQQYQKMNQYENQARYHGYQWIAGIDEVGRGPLAGPVVSAAVMLDSDEMILGLNDSKKLSLKKRNELFTEIKEKALAIGIGIVKASEIDRLNILEASKLAMHEAITQLEKQPEALLVDAVKLDTTIPQMTIVKGDMKSNSIAAASIIAKVTRDEMMVEYDEQYPGYGFANNAGYGTKEHLLGLQELGPTPIHRQSFSPVKKYL
ncbi:MAG TPA: ribonuclease HII [Atopostipes sp.]|nr:ribonuclease HII [Atopostipes sp.]